MPETEDLMTQAAAALDEAKTALARDMARTAAREAYICCLNVARALVFETRQIAPKTHKGTHSKISEVIRSLPDLPQDLPSILGDGYTAKQRIDYGPKIELTMIDAARRVANAERVFTSAMDFLRRQQK